MMRMASIVRRIAGLVAVVLSSGAAAQLGDAVCGNPFQNHYGPFDYRTTSAGQLEIVEKVHFTPAVETLRSGSTSMTPGGDLSYTLNVFPNHHRALMAMARYAAQSKTERPRESARTVACWFDRAERFRPDDAMVKVIHGLYLIQTGKPSEAAAKLEEARELDFNNANVHYNLGLAYLELKSYDKALESAHVAYAQGFPLSGLRDRLKRAGKWREPAAAELPSPVAPPAPAADAPPATSD